MSPRLNCSAEASGCRRVMERLESWVPGLEEWVEMMVWSKMILWEASEGCCGSHLQLLNISQPSHSWRENTEPCLEKENIFKNSCFQVNGDVFQDNIPHSLSFKTRPRMRISKLYFINYLLTVHLKLVHVNLLQVELFLTILKKLNNIISAPGSRIWWETSWNTE